MKRESVNNELHLYPLSIRAFGLDGSLDNNCFKTREPDSVQTASGRVAERGNAKITNKFIAE